VQLAAGATGNTLLTNTIVLNGDTGALRRMIAAQ
jgi:hypothetical protein